MGVGSRVERAGAPVSPRGSAPRPLDLRRGRDMEGGFFGLDEECRWWEVTVFYEARALYEWKRSEAYCTDCTDCSDRSRAEKKKKNNNRGLVLLLTYLMFLRKALDWLRWEIVNIMVYMH